MIRVYTKDEAIEIDQKTILNYGITSEKLIERASFNLAKKFNEKFFGLKKISTVLFFIGPGNNGKDGMGMSTLLESMGYHCELVLFYKETSENEFEPSTVINRIQKIQKEKQLIIVDAIYGIGLSRPLSLNLQNLMNQINLLRNIITVAVDIPSGIDASTGLIFGAALRCDYTFTIGKPKSGLLLNNGGHYSGRISLIDIGFPKELETDLKNPPTYVFTKRDALKLLPTCRSAMVNKSKLGHLWVFSGSEGMTGALQLTTEAAARMGVGYVSYSTLIPNKEDIIVLPDILAKPWPKFTLDTSSSLIQYLKTSLKGISALVIGPGLGRSFEVRELIMNLIAKTKLPTLIDADGINALSDSDKLPAHWILTPHAGELSRLLNVPSSEIESNRIHYAQMAALKFGCIVVLKGFRTVVANNKRQVIIYSGDPSLAKAGTGDVLSGFIGGLLGQGISPFKAACLGVFLHGAIATRYVKKYKNDFTLLASDLKDLLPELIRELRS